MISLIAAIRKQQVYLLPIISLVFIIALLLAPADSISAAKTGLLLWFNTVLPTLLPFIIGGNLLMATGSVYFFEKLFSPIMKPLFNLPGSCAFPWIMGLISGYPMGAKIAGELSKNNEITPAQSQHLISFCNNSGPFFILGAVGIGMLSSQQQGYFLLIIHFISSILLGIFFRFYKKEKPCKTPSYIAVFKASPPIGEVLSDSITNSMEVILQIGGYIIMFSVIGALIKKTTTIKLLGHILYLALAPMGITKELASSWVIGMIEMSNGTYMTSIGQESIQLKLAIISFLIGWGGLSIHAQSISFLRKTPIKISLYLLCKLLHGILAFILAFIFFPIVFLV